MALTQTTPVSSQTSFANPRQIAATTTTQGLVIYTVPAGKKFVGSIYSSIGGMSVGITPSGNSLIDFAGIPASFPSPSTGLILVAGSIVTTQTSNRTFIIGVETDA